MALACPSTATGGQQQLMATSIESECAQLSVATQQNTGRKDPNTLSAEKSSTGLEPSSGSQAILVGL